MRALVLVLVACGGAKPPEPAPEIGPPRPTGPAPATCPGVIYACTDPAVGCFEGGEDFKDAFAAQCKKLGGAEAGHCDPAKTLGSCTTLGMAGTTFAGCSTLWVRAGVMMQTPDDGKAQCAKGGGTWTTTP